MTITTSDKIHAFGALAPSPFQARMRALTQRLPFNYGGRKLASLLLGPAGGRSGNAFDVTIFGSQKARLHPADNICEKRVYVTPQHWDPAERAALANAIAAHTDDCFYFFDVGANAGLYALFARAAAQRAGKKFRAACIEPDKIMGSRAAFNFAASGAEAEISVLPFAVAAEDARLKFAVREDNRGMSRLDADGEVEVEGRTLQRLYDETDFPRIDAMKIDIEGHEYAALAAFFRSANESAWPRFVIMETAHEQGDQRASSLFLDRNYRVTLKTRLNSVLELA